MRLFRNGLKVSLQVLNQESEVLKKDFHWDLNTNRGYKVAISMLDQRLNLFLMRKEIRELPMESEEPVSS